MSISPSLIHTRSRLEGMNQVADMLQFLQNSFTAVFSSIENRVQTERQKLADINRRVGVAQQKITVMSQSNKAFTVVSSAKYPGTASTFYQYTSPFAEQVPLAVDRPNYDYPQSYTGQPDPPSLDPLTAPLSFPTEHYHSALQSTQTLQQKMDGQEASAISAADGLGRLPDAVTSVCGLLLFNSKENPYKSYHSLDNLAGEAAGEVEVQATPDLFMAPKTVREGERIDRYGKIDFAYKPKPAPMLLLDAPSILPGLPKVAPDIGMSQATQQNITSIAPSAIIATLPQLPVVAPTAVAVQPTTASPAAPSIGSFPPPPSGSSVPPPPPVGSIPPPPPLGSVPPPPPVGSIPPPPPVVPVPPPVPGGASALPKGVAELMDAPPPADGGHDALMSSIRAGGFKLRSTKKADAAGGDGPKPKKAKPVTMLDELQNRMKARRHPPPAPPLGHLAWLRRKGIGGRDEDDGGGEDEPARPKKAAAAPKREPKPADRAEGEAPIPRPPKSADLPALPKHDDDQDDEPRAAPARPKKGSLPPPPRRPPSDEDEGEDDDDERASPAPSPSPSTRSGGDEKPVNPMLRGMKGLATIKRGAPATDGADWDD
ncbi:putative WASH complex subunit 1 [Paratrimastix pyriformis]|uniref:WASH complex subunit 1 n=1 Tax=Paratrimastix pyriformis TaxID=342808 RepID=A0ABQ8UQK8_9EUKA|nr:putative WASH complex subunit 1 [Paratrimastix pyriformis]